MSRVNRNTEYSSTTSRRGRCYQICVAVWAAAVIKLCIYDLIMTMKVIQAFENFVTGLWWSTSLWIPYLILISSSLLLYRITETIDSLQNRIEECMSYKRLHDFESLTRNVVPLIDDDFEKKFCDFSDKVLTGVGESYNALCGCIDFFNEVFGSLMFVLVATVVIFQLSLIYYLALNASQNNTLETFTQVIHTTILTIGIILVAMGGENLQDAATGLRRSLTRLNNEVLQGIVI
ncbi:hypothetical protein EVAR_57211_1 [Eumeta japonica]|uniref:Uncharacterized protein n=1 Tax=Eumeta variegata TaxID=151549 RepID=A0A4C1YJM4_EUMVA|nr:hypothetical protein EVAR_57211_1 [Eumeta japonica]